ncbi:MAG: Rieske (2Fe-2S) protein [Lysobacteraceae bacterium]
MLCALSDVLDGGAHEVEGSVDGIAESMILLRQGECVRAFLNVCPHAGRRLDWAPGQFLIDQGVLVCAVHGASFNIPDGLCVAGPCRGESLREVPVAVRDAYVWLVSKTD